MKLFELCQAVKIGNNSYIIKMGMPTVNSLVSEEFVFNDGFMSICTD